MWQLEIHTWGRDSGGPGSGLFMSRDGGVTWTRLHGPRAARPSRSARWRWRSRASNPNRVYALIETGDGVPWKGQETERGQLWRSDDGGDNWQVVSYDRNAMGRAHYYSRMAVAPDDEDEAYFLTASFAKSIDGGTHASPCTQRAEAPGGDHHDIWIDPTNANRQIVAHDQGLSITINRGKTWYRQRLQNAQIYHVTVDNEIPYNVLGNKQDEPTYRGPSNSRLQGGFGGDAGIPRGDVARGRRRRERLGDARSRPTRTSSGRRASGSGMVGGIVVRFEENRRQFRNVEVWPDQSNGPAEGVQYRFVWDAPLHISPHDHNTIYVGSQHVHRTTNGGQSWEVISPDLTLNDKPRWAAPAASRPTTSASSTPASSTASPSRRASRGLIWAGTNDGLVQLTRDSGKTWTNVTKNLPGLPPWGSVRSIAPSRYDAARRTSPSTSTRSTTAIRSSTRPPTTAQTWKLITNGIPKSMLSYAQGDLRGSGAARPALPRHRERDLRRRSTTARTGSRCRTTCRTRRSRASSCRSTSTTW